MKINGREVGFVWTVGAFCDYNDYVVAHEGVSVARANVEKAAAMSREYSRIHAGAEPLTVEEINSLPVYEFVAILKETEAAEQAGSVRTVETEEKKQKNADRK